MNNSEVNPLELWVAPYTMKTALFLEPHRCALDKPKDGWIKVIEYSAYQSLQKENEELKAIIGKLKQAINSLETLQYITPNMREAAYNKAVLDCTNRLLKALKEDGKGMHNDTY